VRRGLAGWLLCATALLVGLSTAALAAENRARGAELDRLQRWCEAQQRSNELLRVENAQREWCLLSEPADSPCWSTETQASRTPAREAPRP